MLSLLEGPKQKKGGAPRVGFDKARKLTPYPLPIVNEGNVEGKSRFAYYESLSDIGYAEIVRIPPMPASLKSC